MLDQTVRSVQHGKGAAVIFLQQDHLRVGEEFFKLQDVRHLGTAPAIDGLVVVADHANVIRRSHQLLQQTHLQGVGILKFINGHTLVLFAKDIAHILVFGEQLFTENQQVIEINRILRAQFVLIGGGEYADEFIVMCSGILTGIFQFRDRPENVLGFQLGVCPALAHQQLFHQSYLVAAGVDRKVFLVSQPLDSAAQQSHAERMEGADRHVLRRFPGDHAADAFAHFRRGLVGECHRENVVGGHLAFEHVGDAARDCAGFSGSGSCQDHDRAVDRSHGIPLRFVQRFK